jgi:asparagine synthetase B (glutamine-hydrolysing)
MPFCERQDSGEIFERHRHAKRFGDVVLVHRRLAIIDPTPEAAQPMAIENGHRIVYNGEVFNYRELKRELEGAVNAPDPK